MNFHGLNGIEVTDKNYRTIASLTSPNVHRSEYSNYLYLAFERLGFSRTVAEFQSLYIARLERFQKRSAAAS